MMNKIFLKAELKTLSKLIDEMTKQTKSSMPQPHYKVPETEIKWPRGQPPLQLWDTVSGLGALTSAVNNNSSDRYNNRYSFIV